VDFGSLFVNKARESIKEVPGIKKTFFTSRQSQAIVSLGISKLFRLKKELGADDLVNLAVITSPPEAQKYSEMIALRILFGDIRDVLSPDFPDNQRKVDNTPDKVPQPAVPSQIKAQHLLLSEVLEFLELQKSVDLEKGLEELKFAEFAEDEIYPSDPDAHADLSYEDKLDLAKKRIAYEQIDGREGILRNQITDWDQLLEEAQNSLRRSIPFANHDDLINSQLLGLQEDIKKLSREDKVKDLADMLQGTTTPLNDSFDQFEQKIDDLSHRELINNWQALNAFDNTLQRLNIPSSKYAPSLKKAMDMMAERLRKEASSLDDILDQPQFFDDFLSREKMEEFFEKSMKYNSPSEMLEQTKKIDDLFGTDMSSSTYDKYQEFFDKASLDELMSNPVPSSEWLDSFNNKLDEVSEDKNAKWEDYHKIAQDLLALKDKIDNEFISKQLDEELEHFVDKMIETAETADQLVESVDFAMDYNIAFDHQKARDKGREVGMSEAEIAKLLGGIFEYLKAMITAKQESFEKVHVLLEKANFSSQKRQELIDLSIEEGSAEALGALASIDLRQVTSNIPDTPEGHDLLEQALGAGGGENMLYQWFEHSSTMPKWLRDIVKKHAKRIMIDLAKKKAASLIGSSEAGPLPEGSTRPYFLGDDPDTIDLDETIDNILDQGKQIEDVVIDDFIVRKTVTGRRCVIFLVDISGSMSGPPLASASIVTAMLLITFARDELGVALFESDTHVLCDIEKHVEIDEVVDEILDLTARGGTQMSAALQWAKKQFDLARSEDKMFIMVTDAYLGDFGNCKEHLREIADLGATSTLIVPHTLLGVGNIQSILQEANAELVPVKNWKDFPEVVSEILSRV